MYVEVNIMTTRQIVLKEIKRIPEPLLNEILDFILFLEVRKKVKIPETALLSESVLKEDWLSKEEDEAWKDL
jgi:hypothetical protein